MSSTGTDELKLEMVILEERLYAFKDKIEMMVSRQAELERRLKEAEARAIEADDLRQKCEELRAENERLRLQIAEVLPS